MRIFVPLLFAFAGCATTTTSLKATSITESTDDELVFLGNDIVVTGDSQTCKTHHYRVDDPHSFLPDTVSYPVCRPHPTHLTLACSARCTIKRESRVTPAAVGPFTVFATITRDDTGAVKQEAFHYNVVPAQRSASVR